MTTTYYLSTVTDGQKLSPSLGLLVISTKYKNERIKMNQNISKRTIIHRSCKTGRGLRGLPVQQPLFSVKHRKLESHSAREETDSDPPDKVSFPNREGLSKASAGTCTGPSRLLLPSPPVYRRLRLNQRPSSYRETASSSCPK